MVQETALTEEQQMTEAADPIVESPDLVEDIVWCASEYRVRFDKLFEAEAEMLTWAAPFLSGGRYWWNHAVVSAMTWPKAGST
jgi:hypothetical protein